MPKDKKRFQKLRTGVKKIRKETQKFLDYIFNKSKDNKEDDQGIKYKNELGNKHNKKNLQRIFSFADLGGLKNSDVFGFFNECYRKIEKKEVE